MLKKGDTVEVKVLDVDPEKRRISLGIKQLTDDPWADLAKNYSVGTEVAECEVARILDRGIIVNINETLEGFIPLNQLGQDVNHPSRIYKVGDKVPAKVVEFDLDGRKIVLSITDYFKEKDPSVWTEHTTQFPIKAAVEVKVAKSKGKKSEDAAAESKDESVESKDEEADLDKGDEEAPVAEGAEVTE